MTRSSGERHIAFEGLGNCRDFGDYAAVGGRLKSGLLYRSSHLAEATDADLERLKALGVQVIVDLRRQEERASEPGRRWPGFAGVVVENDLAEVGAPDAPDMQGRPHPRSPDPAVRRERALAFYRRAAFEARHVDLFRRYFMALAGGAGPVLVHCASGKDRTGILAGLTHRFAGVHDDDAFADFLATNDQLGVRLPYFRAWMLETTGQALDDTTILAMVQVDASYLAATFEALTQRCGSVEGYLDQVLELDTPTRRRVLAHLLA